MPDAPDELMTVPAAAKAANVPERSLFRAVEKGRIPNTKREGVTLVALPDVLAWAERRAAAKAGAAPATATAGSLPAAPAMAAAVGSRFGREAVPTADGALAAEVFDSFEAGKSPTEVVRGMELPPRLVLDLWKQHEDLQNAGRPGRPPITEQISALEQRVESLVIEVQTATEYGTIVSTVAQLRADLDFLARVVRELPVPPLSGFTCTSCRSTGWVESYIRCTACGKQTTWGFRPKKQ